MTYIFDISTKEIQIDTFTHKWKQIDLILTLKNTIVIIYRIVLNYFLLNYLFLTVFVTASAYEYYISELNRRKIKEI